MTKAHYNRMTQKEISIQNQAEIKALTEKVATLEQTTSETNADVKRILFFFNSDATTKTEGFIEKSNRHDSEIKHLDGLVKNGKAIVLVLGLMSSIVGSLLTWFFKLK